MKLSVDVHNFLQNLDIPHEFFVMETPAKDSSQTAALLGLKPKEVVKSVILFINGKPATVIIPSNKEVCLKKMKAKYPLAEIEFADAKSIVETTGYIFGATPPVAHAKPGKTIIDQECFESEVLYTGGGEINAMLKIRPYDLQKLTKADICDITE